MRCSRCDDEINPVDGWCSCMLNGVIKSPIILEPIDGETQEEFDARYEEAMKMAFPEQTDDGEKIPF